ncbi:lectin c-type domain-containing protein [Phthorimaea operculella]|nr:lectin c-type domain-containing protein [Phthorimaea operculella]
MVSSVLKLILCLVNGVVFANGQENYFFRDDYTYLSSTQSFYKYHHSFMSWNDAKEKCEQEGAILFYANDRNEALEVMAFWRQQVRSPRMSPRRNIFVGIYCKTDEDCETVDGRSSHAVNIDWTSGEPKVRTSLYDEECNCGRASDTGFFETYTYLCTRTSPFICKKTLEDYQRDQVYSTTLPSTYNTPQEAEEIQFSKGGFMACNCYLVLILAVVLLFKY